MATILPPGPHLISSAERRINVQQIAQRLRLHYGTDLLAFGVYGSLSRSSDGPFSDIEMHCILQGEHIDTSLEWTTGPWKAEVDIYSPDVILARASEIDGDWPITHSQFTGVWILHDPTRLFPRLEALARSHPEAVFDQVITEVIVGDIYELVGKVRNAHFRQETASLPFYTMLLARSAACLLGLANQHLFTSSSNLFTESLELPNHPAGYDALCQAVIHGELADPQKNVLFVEDFWHGVITWAIHRRLEVETTLERLLSDG